MRDVIFISHANPEDNSFSQWLALQLGKEGYPVWCDLTRLLGGEDFWANIEDVIRTRACKFLYVLSRSSNQKQGPRQELHLAQSVARAEHLQDFVIPLRIDDLPYGDINIQLAHINAIDFTIGWASGLRTLQRKFQQDDVKKDLRFSPGAVASWWESQYAADVSLESAPEDYLSSWFRILELPPYIYLHSIQAANVRSVRYNMLPYPARRYEQFLVSFATKDALETGIGVSDPTSSTLAVPTIEFLKGITHPTSIRERDGGNIVSDLLRNGWENYLRSMGMRTFKLSGRSVAGYVTNGFLVSNKVSVPRPTGRNTSRNIVGYRTRKDAQGHVVGHRFWHFAIEGQPMLHPMLAFRMVTHVLFSNDGQRIWSNKSRLHRARRGETTDWWNPEWRDRTLGTVNWLAQGKSCVRIPLGIEAAALIESTPVSFTSPISYRDPSTKQIRDDDDVGENDDDQVEGLD